LHQDVEHQMRSAQIVLYTQTGCRESRRVRDWLMERGVAFSERSVTNDLSAARELLATGCFGTPLLVTGQTKVIGFRPTTIAAGLNLVEIET